MDDKGFTLDWDEKNQIFRGTVKDIDEKVAKDIVAASTAAQQEKNVQQAKYLIDISANSKVTREARSVFMTFVNRPDVSKLAFIGAKPFIRTLVNFVFIAQFNKKIKFFGTEQEALQWLQS